MHIAEVKQLNAVDGWVDFQGQITKVGEVKSRIKSERSKTPGQQYNVQKIAVADETGDMGVWAYADKQYLPNQYVAVHGMLKEFNNVRYIDYADVKPNTIGEQGQLQTPQKPQQAPSRAVQSPNGEKEMRIVRGNALNATMSAADIMPDEIEKYLLAGVQFILTGKWDVPTAMPKGTQVIPEDDNPPWES